MKSRRSRSLRYSSTATGLTEPEVVKLAPQAFGALLLFLAIFRRIKRKRNLEQHAMRFGDDAHRRFDFDLELALLDAHLRELLVGLVKLDLLVGDRLASAIDGVTQVTLPGLFDLGTIAQDFRLFLHAFAQAREHVVERLDTQTQNLELGSRSRARPARSPRAGRLPS